MTRDRIHAIVDSSRLARIDGALTALEADLDLLIALTDDQRQQRAGMGSTSRAFCATALEVARQHAGLMPRDVDIDALRLQQQGLDALRPRAARLARLMQRMADTELALGSDLMTGALAIYRVLKVAGKDERANGARREPASRSSRRHAAADSTPCEPAPT